MIDVATFVMPAALLTRSNRGSRSSSNHLNSGLLVDSFGTLSRRTTNGVVSGWYSRIVDRMSGRRLAWRVLPVPRAPVMLGAVGIALAPFVLLGYGVRVRPRPVSCAEIAVPVPSRDGWRERKSVSAEPSRRPGCAAPGHR